MADIQVTHGVHVFGATEDTETITLPVGAVTSATSAFVKNPSPTWVANRDATGTIQSNPDDAGVEITLAFNDPDWELTFTRQSTGVNEEMRVPYEVWDFNAGGATVLLHETVTVLDTNTTADSTSFSPGDSSQVIPFICSLRPEVTLPGWDRCSVRATIEAGNVIRLHRGDPTDNIHVVVAAVEFTDTAWEVQNNITHTFVASGVVETETITDVNDWNKTFIETGKENSNNTVSSFHCGHLCYPGDSTTSLKFYLSSGAIQATTTLVTSHVAYHPGLVVEHFRSAIDGGTESTVGPSDNTVNIAVTAVMTNMAASLNCSSANGASALQYMGEFVNMRLSSQTNVEIYRSKANGTVTVDYAGQVVDFMDVMTSGGGGAPVGGITLRS
jgi:hypothetical protein